MTKLNHQPSRITAIGIFMKTFFDSSSKDVSLVLSIYELITLRKIISAGVVAIREEIENEYPRNVPFDFERYFSDYRIFRDCLYNSTDDLVYK